MEGFSEDKYIICQDYFKDYPYRTVQSSRNGCGWIAAYNLRLALGQDVYFDDVRAEMDEMHKFRVPGPTVMPVMRKYLKKYVINFRETSGKANVITAMKYARAGIIRYYEEGIPHFVTFVRQPGGKFRFFNVNDGMEDFCATVPDFASAHFKRGSYSVFTVN